MRALSRALAARGAVSRPFDPKALSRMLDEKLEPGTGIEPATY
jgi:hypothetical protein